MCAVTHDTPDVKLHTASLQEAARAEAQALADAAAVGGEASEREARDLAAATERQEAVCRSLLHELRFKKHAALEAGALPPCADTRTQTCGTDRPSIGCLTTARSSCTAILELCIVLMWLPGSICMSRAAAMSCPSPAQLVHALHVPVTDTRSG